MTIYKQLKSSNFLHLTSCRYYMLNSIHYARMFLSTSPVLLKSKKDGKEENEIHVPNSKLFSFTAFVKMEKLNDLEKFIHQKHMAALQKRQEIYTDPVTGYDVLTRYAHLRRGKCCGSACRHCPFGQKSVLDEKLKKKFNSAFYV